MDKFFRGKLEPENSKFRKENNIFKI